MRWRGEEEERGGEEDIREGQEEKERGERKEEKERGERKEREDLCMANVRHRRPLVWPVTMQVVLSIVQCPLSTVQSPLHSPVETCQRSR